MGEKEGRGKYMDKSNISVTLNNGEEQKTFEKFLLIAFEEGNLKSVICYMSPMELSFCISRLQAQLIKILNKTE